MKLFKAQTANGEIVELFVEHENGRIMRRQRFDNAGEMVGKTAGNNLPWIPADEIPAHIIAEDEDLANAVGRAEARWVHQTKMFNC